MESDGNGQVNPQTQTGTQESQNQTTEARDDLPPTVHVFQSPPTPAADYPPNKEASKWRENTKLSLEITGLLVLIVYTVFSCLQWLQIRWTNRLTREALDGSAISLRQTLDKMQGEINEMKRLADNAGTQADRTDVLQISGLLAGDVKESRNDNPTRDLQMAANRTRPHTLCGPVVSSLFSFAARC
jgi:hypothetical protein